MHVMGWLKDFMRRRGRARLRRRRFDRFGRRRDFFGGQVLSERHGMAGEEA